MQEPFTPMNIKTVHMDIVGNCNLRCPSCPRGKGKIINDKTLPFMSLNLFRKIVSKLRNDYPQVKDIDIYNWGEPLLHPNLVELISFAKSLQFEVNISSNLNKTVDFYEIMQYNPKNFCISLSGWYQNTYNRFHAGGNIEKVKMNMHLLSLAKEQTGATTNVYIYYHKYKTNLMEMKLMEKYAKDLGFGFATYYAKHMVFEELIALADNFMGKNKDEFITSEYLLPVLPAMEIAKKYRMPCPLLYNQIAFTYKGEVLQCCGTFEPEGIVGNYLDMNTDEIAKKRISNPICSSCISYGVSSYSCQIPGLMEEYDELVNNLQKTKNEQALQNCEKGNDAGQATYKIKQKGVQNKLKMESTGERLVPDNPERESLFLEHITRYMFASQYVKDKIVFDAGCGCGYGSYHLLKSGAKKVTGIDISKETIEYCKSNYENKNLEFKVMNAEKLSFPDKVFDVVVSFEVVEHLQNPEMYLSEIKRVLKTDGILIISTPNKKIYTDAVEDWKNPFHIHEYYIDEFDVFLKKYFSEITFWGQDYFEGMIIEKQFLEKNKREQTTDFKVLPIHTQPTWKDSSENFQVFEKFIYIIAVCGKVEKQNVPMNHLIYGFPIKYLEEKNNNEKKLRNESFQGKDRIIQEKENIIQAKESIIKEKDKLIEELKIKGRETIQNEFDTTAKFQSYIKRLKELYEKQIRLLEEEIKNKK
ncbi:MAG: methyltransferase domain-containing protein [bacterium]